MRSAGEANSPLPVEAPRQVVLAHTWVVQPARVVVRVQVDLDQCARAMQRRNYVVGDAVDWLMPGFFWV